MFQGHGVALAPGSETGGTLVTEKLGMDRKFKGLPKDDGDDSEQVTEAERQAEREAEQAADRAAAAQQL